MNDLVENPSPTENPSPRDAGRLSRRQVLVLLGLVMVNLCLYGAIWLLGQGNEPGSQTVAWPMGAAVELRTAYEQASALASGWQSDATLVGVTTSWQLASGDRLTLHRPVWSFSFHSPLAHQVQVIVVDESGAQAGPRQSAWKAPRSVMADWSLDSEDLLLTLLSYGGEAFISAHPSANIHLQLRAGGADRSIWYITAVDPVARQSLVVGVDAQTRQVVLSETNGGEG